MYTYTHAHTHTHTHTYADDLRAALSALKHIRLHPRRSSAWLLHPWTLGIQENTFYKRTHSTREHIL